MDNTNQINDDITPTIIAEFNEMPFTCGATLLSVGELESTWPCSIQKYCRVQRNREFVPVQWGRWGRQTMKRCGRESTGRLYGRGTNPCVTCWKDPYNGPEEEENSVR